MKLIYHPASPYSRKTRITAYETGLWDKIDFLNPGLLSPVIPKEDVVKHNPLGKIPALVLNDGTCIVDSRVICEYFDSQNNGQKLFPEEGQERITALTLQALGDGLLDAAVINRYETAFRPEELNWDEWINAQRSRIFRVLDHFNIHCSDFNEKPNIGSITIAVCLGYLDFRYPEDDWRQGRNDLAGWFEEFSARESMQLTIPKV
ncbi:MAG: glutathione S-transferase [Pseudomonadota bacterium]